MEASEPAFGANEVRANKVGANKVGANEVEANELEANELEALDGEGQRGGAARQWRLSLEGDGWLRGRLGHVMTCDDV